MDRQHAEERGQHGIAHTAAQHRDQGGQQAAQDAADVPTGFREEMEAQRPQPVRTIVHRVHHGRRIERDRDDAEGVDQEGGCAVTDRQDARGDAGYHDDRDHAQQPVAMAEIEHTPGSEA
ncbi:MAG: hypothetical protein WDN69_09495 [Aliidongia sp.]